MCCGPGCSAPSATAASVAAAHYTARTLTYYQCPHDPGIRRHAAAHSDHRNVTVREEPVLDAITGFYAERVFGPDRAALLAAIIPATTAAQTARTTARTKALRKKLAKIDVAETALITELETPADPDDPAAQALRNRIRARFTELYAERTAINADLAALEATTNKPADDPTLLDELPILGDIVSDAPAALVEKLLAIFDPRADHNQASDPAPTRHDQIAHSARPTGSSPGRQRFLCGRRRRRGLRPAGSRSGSGSTAGSHPGAAGMAVRVPSCGSLARASGTYLGYARA
jgi:hypothetical protein